MATANRIPYLIGDWLQRFPLFYRKAKRLYGILKFKPSGVAYKSKTNANDDLSSLGGNFEMVFDAQCLQTQTYQRGIGKFSLSLIKAICDLNPKSKYAAFVTSIASPSNTAKAIDLLNSLDCPNLTVLVLNPCSLHGKTSMFLAQRKLALQIDKLTSRYFVQLSVFENPRHVVLNTEPTKAKKIAILYDLIPLEFPTDILISRRQLSTYHWGLDVLENHELIWCISETSQRQFKKLRGYGGESVVIYGGSPESKTSSTFGFENRVGVLCIGSEQKHKNVINLIRAYLELPELIREKNPLTLVGIRSSGYRKYLRLNFRGSEGYLRIPEYLTNDELSDLYCKSRLLVMPSLSEGLSLPILEAWSHGLVTIGSLGTPAEELIENDSLLFNPKDVSSISECMRSLLADETLWNNSIAHLHSKKNFFTWEKTAMRAVTSLESNGNSN